MGSVLAQALGHGAGGGMSLWEHAGQLEARALPRGGLWGGCPRREDTGGRSRPFLAVPGSPGPRPGLQPYRALRSLGTMAAVKGLPGNEVAVTVALVAPAPWALAAGRRVGMLTSFPEPVLVCFGLCREAGCGAGECPWVAYYLEEVAQGTSVPAVSHGGREELVVAARLWPVVSKAMRSRDQGCGSWCVWAGGLEAGFLGARCGFPSGHAVV